MKYLRLILLGLVALSLAPLHAQEQSKAVPPSTQQEPALVKFDLNFPGGTPGELVAAIQKATGRPLNAIIYPEDANRQLPPLKMNGVTVPELFGALSDASTRSRKIGYVPFMERLSFVTRGKSTDDSVWYLKIESNEINLSKDTRFYPLSDFLDQGLTVDDITTAIQTAWKLRGDNPTPTLNYHKETKLLIAVGYSAQLSTIDDALKALRPKPKPLIEAEPKEAPSDPKQKT